MNENIKNSIAPQYIRVCVTGHLFESAEPSNIKDTSTDREFIPHTWLMYFLCFNVRINNIPSYFINIKDTFINRVHKNIY